MAEIRNYTMNFAFGRPPMAALTCGDEACRKLACAEAHREDALDG